MDNILVIILLTGAIWYWWDTQQCNEVALTVCQRKTSAKGLQLLDATVIRQRTWLRRSNNGWVEICRFYSFEFINPHAAPAVGSEHGMREQGYIVLIGKQVVEVSLPDVIVNIN